MGSTWHDIHEHILLNSLNARQILGVPLLLQSDFTEIQMYSSSANFIKDPFVARPHVRLQETRRKDHLLLSSSGTVRLIESAGLLLPEHHLLSVPFR